MSGRGKLVHALLAVAALALIALGAALEAIDEQRVPEPTRSAMGVGR